VENKSAKHWRFCYNSKMILKRGFTLMELMVVISIIALLASVVLASLNTARRKGTVAAALKFEGYVTHTQGDRAVVWWKFNEGSGSTALDSSGFGNNGAISPVPTPSATPQVYYDSDISHTSKGTSLYFSGASGYVQAVLPASQATTNAAGYTMMAWIKPQNTGGTQIFLSRFVTDFKFDTAGNLSMRTWCSVCGTGSTLTAGKINYNEWTHVAAVLTSDNVQHIYVNGKEVGSQTDANLPVAVPGTWFMAGSGEWPAGTPSSFYKGNMDDVVFLNDAILASDVFKHYSETKDLHRDKTD
jgi:prepilin-type N-terminal cleavage/methylation domain-containing protein